MGILLINVCLAAFKDGYSPNMLMVAAVLIALYLLSWYQSIKINFFVGMFVVETLLFVFFAHLDFVTFNNPMRIFSIFYDLIAGLFLVVGIVLLADWIKSNKEGASRLLMLEGCAQGEPRKLPIWQAYLLSLMTVLAALSLTIKDLSWAMDPYMVALSNNIYGGVARLVSLLSLCLYTLLKFWIIWVVIFLFSASMLSKRLKIMVATAFFLAAGSMLFYVK